MLRLTIPPQRQLARLCLFKSRTNTEGGEHCPRLHPPEGQKGPRLEQELRTQGEKGLPPMMETQQHQPMGGLCFCPQTTCLAVSLLCSAPSSLEPHLGRRAGLSAMPLLSSGHQPLVSFLLARATQQLSEGRVPLPRSMSTSWSNPDPGNESHLVSSAAVRSPPKPGSEHQASVT